MPLIQGKSKKSFEKNMKTEMGAGKPKDQSLAIAYSVQRKNRKKMALGGATEGPTHSDNYDPNPGTPMKKADDMQLPKSDYMASDMDAPVGSTKAGSTMITISKEEYDALRSGGNYAEGGMAGNPKLQQAHAAHRPMHPMDLMDDDERATSIADAILEKRHKMAEGGMVDLERNSEEEGSTPYDRMNMEAGMKEQYDDSQLESDPRDSNETGDAREDESENQEDEGMISRIHKKMKAKRG